MMTPQQQDRAFGAQVQAQPGFQAFMAQQNAMQNSLQQSRQNLMNSGNAQLGVMSRFAPEAGELPSAPFGTSVLPGVVQRGGVANMVGVPTQVPSLDASVDARLALMKQRSATNTARANMRFQQSLADNADTFKEWGVTPGDNFIGGKTYVDGGGMQWRSNSAIAREQMTPEQLAKNDAYLAAKADRKAAVQQMRTQRAQYQNAQRGTGVMYAPDGSIDFNNTLTARTAAFNPALAMKNAMDMQTQQATIATQQAAMKEALAKGEYGRSDTAHQRALEMAQILDPSSKTKPPINPQEMMASRVAAMQQPPEVRLAGMYAEGDALLASPDQAQEIITQSGVSPQELITEYAAIHDNPNWVRPRTAEQKADLDRKKRSLEASMKARGIEPPKIQDNPMPWAMRQNPLAPIIHASGLDSIMEPYWQ